MMARMIEPSEGPPMRFRCLALLILAASLPAAAAHGDPKQPISARDAPRMLSDAEMDQVTAGSLTLSLDLAAAATGPAAFAHTQGATRIERATMLKLAPVPGAPPQAQARLLGEQAAEIAIGSGRAAASGDGTASCTARVDALGEIAFLRSISAATIAPGSATCLCSLFAIAPIR